MNLSVKFSIILFSFLFIVLSIPETKSMRLSNDKDNLVDNEVQKSRDSSDGVYNDSLMENGPKDEHLRDVFKNEPLKDECSLTIGTLKRETRVNKVLDKDLKVARDTELREIFGNDQMEKVGVLEELKSIIASPNKPKGVNPCKKPIHGPSFYHKIAIVGAGIAGLHMAHLLREKGYRRIVILEKDSRIGGKVLTVKHAGVRHEMGACYTSPDYNTSIYELAKKFGIDDFVAVEPGTVWLDSAPGPLSFNQYVIMEIMKLTGTKDPKIAQAKLIEAAFRYSQLHIDMFGKYEGELMYRPHPEVFEKLGITFQKFLEQHKLTALLPILRVIHTMQGYGQLDTVSALYGLMWNTPNLIRHMIDRSNQEDAPIKMFRNGFSQIIDRLKVGLDIRLNARIEQIKRTPWGMNIKYSDGQSRSEWFNFLIWAANAQEALNVLEKVAAEEELLTRMKKYSFSTTLFDSYEKKKSLTPVDYWISNLQKKRDGSVWGRRESREVLHENICQISPGEDRRVTSVGYQFSTRSRVECNTINNKLRDHFKDFGAKNLTTVLRKIWDYFPHYDVEDMATGILWDILENQGKHNTWYIGSSVCFDTTKSVIEYNKLLLRIRRSRKCKG